MNYPTLEGTSHFHLSFLSTIGGLDQSSSWNKIQVSRHFDVKILLL